MKLLFLTTLLASSAAWGSIWTASPGKQWNSSWEKKYSKWVATQTGPNFFKKLGSPYAELKLDCADVHYGFLAYFSRQNGLPFAIKGGKVNNNSSRFDRHSSREKRMAEFIKHVAEYNGTENLAHGDTIPVGVRSVRPGDLFMYKVGSGENVTRHTYIVKGINIDGTFDVMFSTQQRAREGRPLRRDPTYTFKKAPLNTGRDKNHWGFRRQKRPQQMAISQEKLGADFSQYALARKLGRVQFFREVKRINQRIEESPQMIASRNFKNFCSGVKNRVGLVKSGLRYAAQIGGRCMNSQEYDENSTPNNDSGLKDDITNYAIDIRNINKRRKLRKIKRTLRKVSVSIVGRGSLSKRERSRIFKMCPVKTSAGNIDLGSFKRNLVANRVSFHPNDNKFRRWGILKGNKTRCTTYYGYPN